MSDSTTSPLRRRLLAGGAAAYITKKSIWVGALRQLAFGLIAIAATYAVGDLIGSVV